MQIFLTGIGSGLGEALAKEYLESGAKVYALSRHLPRSLEGYSDLRFVPMDLAAIERIGWAMEQLLKEAKIDLAILNAGILGKLCDMEETTLSQIEQVMDINVWANKVILDHLKHHNPKQIVAISSGASVSGARGWNAYALSKATLNMLIKLYAAEMPHTHLCALAPGLIDTPMMEQIVTSEDDERFGVVRRLKSSSRMSPQEAARLLIAHFARLLEYPSGSYLDIRKLAL